MRPVLAREMTSEVAFEPQRLAAQRTQVEKTTSLNLLQVARLEVLLQSRHAAEPDGLVRTQRAHEVGTGEIEVRQISDPDG